MKMNHLVLCYTITTTYKIQTGALSLGTAIFDHFTLYKFTNCDFKAL